MLRTTLALAVTLVTASAAVSSDLRWHDDLDAALADARATGKPVLVYVYDSV